MITLRQFIATKKIVKEVFPYNIPDGNLGVHVMREIRNALDENPVHVLIDSWCGKEKEYTATMSDCTETSWNDHDPSRCLTCKIQEVILRDLPVYNCMDHMEKKFHVTRIFKNS